MFPSMGTQASVPQYLFIFFFLFQIGQTAASPDANFQTYIVHLHPSSMEDSGFQTKYQWHQSYLESATSSNDSSSRLLYSYHTAIDGFAARLTEQEASVLRTAKGVITIHPDRFIELQTTYSYKFLGLDHLSGSVGAQPELKLGQGSIIGVLDTGVWPESPSFDDRGMPLVPKRWKGVCQAGEKFGPQNCNRKLIGARFYSRSHHLSPSEGVSVDSGHEYISARDARGHGTHTASTAAGAVVAGANVLGNAAGDARGMAPGAHVAIYKVCWFSGCYSSDILAGIDDAIRDGVDVLSMSLGGYPVPLYDDSIAIGAFRAIERGIFVSCAAGNNGPAPASVANEAPWIMTVGASSTDRRFPAILRLGNGHYLYGESLYPGRQFDRYNNGNWKHRGTFGGREFELVYQAGGKEGSEMCFNTTLARELVGGKMVVCDRGVTGRAMKGEVVREAGGAGMVLANAAVNGEEDSVDVHVLPATLIGYKESLVLKSYIKSSRRPTARILFGGTKYGSSNSPSVATFSSRGPSLTNPSVLKPDILAPGANIVAAWPENLGPSGLPEDNRRVNFTVLSGTSMACPHISGIAALIKSVHRSWSPAAIKSAIMTTANVLNQHGKPIAGGLFATGAGNVNPLRAIDPGLVYDMEPIEYIPHLCSLGYERTEIYTITHRNVSCREVLKANRGRGLNYPSMSVMFKNSRVVVLYRRLRNVGLPNSTYSVEVTAPQGVEITVRPQTLTFGYLDQSLSYKVLLVSRPKKLRKGEKFHEEGSLTWVHHRRGSYKVRSPISVTWVG
ncbi:subtilisin-like protease SBT1.2 [Nymphaea colorata]|uniref:Uncharacterized protein n=1 Tax=Nymphaea colorata TaxID=210225 RepID=A0A5K1D4Q5_9MAGN|nr:subtilisin-like protease SBT1.2 [Nymphaea colorata]